MSACSNKHDQTWSEFNYVSNPFTLIYRNAWYFMLCVFFRNIIYIETSIASPSLKVISIFLAFWNRNFMAVNAM